MKSNSGTIFVLIGDRRLVNKATKVLLNHTTRVTTFNGWFFELQLHTTNIVGRMSLERRITQTTQNTLHNSQWCYICPMQNMKIAGLSICVDTYVYQSLKSSDGTCDRDRISALLIRYCYIKILVSISHTILSNITYCH